MNTVAESLRRAAERLAEADPDERWKHKCPLLLVDNGKAVSVFHRMFLQQWDTPDRTKEPMLLALLLCADIVEDQP